MLANLGLLLVAVIASSFVGEIAVRVLFPDMVLFPRYHAAATYGDFVLRRMQPNIVFRHRSPDGVWWFTTNAQGFRDTEDYPYARREGVLRILSLGDSHTLGFEVRQDRTYSEVIARYLASRGVTAEVFNTGISGFGTAEELVFLEQEGIKYRPAAVVLAFYGNDFDDNIKAGLLALDNGALVVRKQRHAPGVRALRVVNAIPPLRWLSENSYLYSLGMNTAWNTAKRMLLSRAEAELETEYAIAPKAVSGYKKELAARLIERMYAFCKSHGIRLVILDLPRPDGQSQFRASVPEDLVETFRANSDVFIGSDVLDPYRGLAETHLPHGHRHIAELTHLILGMKAGEALQCLTSPGRSEMRGRCDETGSSRRSSNQQVEGATLQ